jgi:hypothetical protein
MFYQLEGAYSFSCCGINIFTPTVTFRRDKRQPPNKPITSREYKLMLNLTLKYRHPDRYLSASQKVAASEDAENRYKEDDDDIETKFEEDILRQSVSTR